MVSRAGRDLAIAETVVVVLGCVQGIVLTRLLGPESYGVYAAAAHAATSLGRLPTAYLLRPGIAWFCAQTNVIQARQAIWHGVTRASWIVLAVMVLLSWLAGQAGEWVYAGTLGIFAVQAFATAQLLGARIILHAQNEAGRVARGNVAQGMGVFLAATLLTVLGAGALGAATGFLLGTLIPVGWWWLALSQQRFPRRSPTSINFVRQQLISGTAMVLFQLAKIVDMLAIPFALDEAAAGFYGVSRYFGILVMPLAHALGMSLLPTLSRCARGGYHRTCDHLHVLGLRWLLLMVPALTAVILKREAILFFLFGEPFLPAADLLPWTVSVALAAPCWQLLSSRWLAKGKARQLFALGAATLVLLVAGLLWLVPQRGIEGAAIAFFVSGLPVALTTFATALKSQKRRSAFRAIAAAIVACTVVVATNFTATSGLLSVAIAMAQALLGSFAYVLLGGVRWQWLRRMV